MGKSESLESIMARRNRAIQAVEDRLPEFRMDDADYQAGMAAFSSGRTESSCRHPTGARRFSWLSGWYAARTEASLEAKREAREKQARRGVRRGPDICPVS